MFDFENKAIGRVWGKCQKSVKEGSSLVKIQEIDGYLY